MEGYLAIENGTVFKGEVFGAQGESFGELIFNTSMTGYQEILYDPSYKGQIAVMTYPLIGNYGINEQDAESAKVHLAGFIVRERSKIYSNWRATKPLDLLLYEHGITGIEGIDTRKITLMLREKGALKAGVFAGKNSREYMLKKVQASPDIVGVDLVKEVAAKAPYVWSGKGRHKVVVLDCGVKYNTLRLLASRDCRVTVMPPDTPWQEIVKEEPEGVLVSNGPGDPAAVGYIVDTLSNIIERYPVFGICFGIQLIAQVFGGKTYKLKFGHHGANHPVKDVKADRVLITVQNHGFCVDADTLGNNIETTHINLNDNTLEGFAHRKLPVFAVQFHPEHAPGPTDAVYLFDRFKKLLGKKQNG